MDYQKLCNEVQQIARETGSFIRKEQNKIKRENIETKSVASLVTYVDKTAEQQIVEALKKLIPESGFVAEEGTAVNNKEEYIWFIDPLDGTTNYLHGLAPHSVSIALAVSFLVYLLIREPAKPVAGGTDLLFTGGAAAVTAASVSAGARSKRSSRRRPGRD